MTLEVIAGQVMHCIHTGKVLDQNIIYCPDCNRMDCAVNAGELLAFHTNETDGKFFPDDLDDLLPIHEFIMAVFGWEFNNDRGLLEMWADKFGELYFSDDLYDETYDMLARIMGR